MTETTATAPATQGAAPTSKPPAIAQIWAGQGGIYIGVSRGEDGQPDGHLVMALNTPTTDLDWATAIEWAKGVQADGHADFRLPTRSESALIYANARDQVDDDYWYWTGTEYSGSYAWGQSFGGGGQYYSRKSYEGRARAVRRLPLQSFDPSTEAA